MSVAVDCGIRGCKEWKAYWVETGFRFSGVVRRDLSLGSWEELGGGAAVRLVSRRLEDGPLDSPSSYSFAGSVHPRRERRCPSIC